jgi:hypothetical protein
MSVQEMKRAIREGHEVTRHGEFLANVMHKRDVELLDLYLDSDPALPDRWSGVTYPRSPALVRRLLARGLDPNRPHWLGKTFLHACAENVSSRSIVQFAVGRHSQRPGRARIAAECHLPNAPL